MAGEGAMRSVAAGTASTAAPLAGALVLLGACSGADGDRAWELATPALMAPALTLAEAGESHPTVAVDPRSGGTLVAWIEETGAGGDVLVARVGSEGAVEAAARANDRPGEAASQAQAPAQVRVGPDGAVHVVWQRTYHVPERRFPASDLRYAQADASSSDSLRFTTPLYVNEDAGGAPASHTFHDVAVGPDGTVWVSWIDGRKRAAAEAGRGDSGEGEQAAEGPAGHARSHAHGHPAEAEATLPTPEVRLARLAPSDSVFRVSDPIAADVCPCCRTSLALGPEGTLYLAWRRVFPGDVRDVVVARSEDGGRSFSAPVRVHEDGWRIAACPHAGPSVAVDGEGTVHVAWYTGREEESGVYHAVSRDGGRSFGPRRPLAAEGSTAPALVRLAAAGNAGVWAVWEEGARPPRLRAALLASDGSASPSGPALSGFAPSLDIAAGRLALVWLEGDAVRLKDGRLQSPATEVGGRFCSGGG